jgi:Zn finger protein HypA/HybF involved in hydrogenase expression
VHDFLLAKEIIDKTLAIIKDKNLEKIESVDIEIGIISLAHDGFGEHPEEINLENLEFGLKNIAKNTILEKTAFNIKKIPGESWKITNIKTK